MSYIMRNLLPIFAEANGKPVHWMDLAAAWEDRPLDADTEHLVRTGIYRMRSRGIEIERVRGVGYRLVGVLPSMPVRTDRKRRDLTRTEEAVLACVQAGGGLAVPVAAISRAISAVRATRDSAQSVRGHVSAINPLLTDGRIVNQRGVGYRWVPHLPAPIGDSASHGVRA